jgi:hypothetical protein
VIKGSTSNNAVEVFVVSTLTEALAAVAALGLPPDGEEDGKEEQEQEQSSVATAVVDGRRAAAAAATTTAAAAEEEEEEAAAAEEEEEQAAATTTTTTMTTTTTSWVVQEYVARPLLLRGQHKFHLRVNVLVVGDAQVFVHRNFVCHAATEVGGWVAWVDRVERWLAWWAVAGRAAGCLPGWPGW